MVWNVSSFRPIKVEKDCAVMNYHTNYLLNATISLSLSLSSSLNLLSLAPGMHRVRQTGNTAWEKTRWESTMDPLWNWNFLLNDTHFAKVASLFGIYLCLAWTKLCIWTTWLMEEDEEPTIWTKGTVCRQYSSFQIFHFKRCLSSS